MTAVLVIALILAVVAITLVLFFRSMASEQVRTAQTESRRLQSALDDVKEVAWSNRDIAPDLSTIIIDTIRSAERNHPELPG